MRISLVFKKLSKFCPLTSLLFAASISLSFLTACAPALMAGGAGAGYYVGNDKRSFKQIIQDASITTKIKAKFVHDRHVSAFDININTRSGVVTFYGSVANRIVEDRAIQLASDVEGIRKIVSKLTIVGDV